MEITKDTQLRVVVERIKTAILQSQERAARNRFLYTRSVNDNAVSKPIQQPMAVKLENSTDEQLVPKV